MVSIGVNEGDIMELAKGETENKVEIGEGEEVPKFEVTVLLSHPVTKRLIATSDVMLTIPK
jgi:hypothetical protein